MEDKELEELIKMGLLKKLTPREIVERTQELTARKILDLFKQRFRPELKARNCVCCAGYSKALASFETELKKKVSHYVRR